MNMAVSRFLQQHTKFISILEGGYPSLHSDNSIVETKVLFPVPVPVISVCCCRHVFIQGCILC